MAKATQLRALVATVAAAAAIAVGCAEEQATTPRMSFDTRDPQAPEGEFIGSLYVDGEKSPQGYNASLQPADSATSARLRPPHSTQMWANPAFSRMWEWYDPKAGGGCGDLAPYLAGDTTGRYPEGHWSGPDSAPDPSKAEKHCLRPGVYRFAVADKTFLVDYVPVVSVGTGGALQVWNATAGVYETVEDQNPDDTTNVWVDVVANVDIGTSSYGETPCPWSPERACDLGHQCVPGRAEPHRQ